MRVTATEATSRLGSLSAQAGREPVFVEKAGRVDPVTLSAEQVEALRSQQTEPGRELRRRQAFEATYGTWIAAENARCETQGIPGADLRPW
ncbi:prevent-host-death protein [Piscinibacter sakaiensis]|uniref:hypothetical protein n=1 Tax=Piscinibacter sakaiensis TaxID=1547922 RepID=UPI0006B62A3E|nr:hypothetical protein [Piscinibacter sakaiensis]